MDLHPLCEQPIVLHSREIDCWVMCGSRDELTIGTYDSRVVVFNMSKQMETRKTDESSLSTHEVVLCSFKKRLSWSVGSGSIWPHALCLDENYHLQGYRLFVAVRTDLVAYDYDTGALLFRANCHSKILSMDMRRDMPCVVAGTQAKHVIVDSVREGSWGKVLDTLTGHLAPVSNVRIDHETHVCYTLDSESELCCWNLDHPVLLHRQHLAKKSLNDAHKKHDSIWRKVELYPSKTRFELAHMFERTVVLAHSSDHHETLIEIDDHLRYVATRQTPSPGRNSQKTALYSLYDILHVPS